MSGSTPLLEVRELHTWFSRRSGLFGRNSVPLKAVNGVSLQLQRGRTIGLVGESGCGKSTLGRSILRLVDPVSGEIRFAGQDITRLRGQALKPLRRQMQVIFQDPWASLSPRRTVFQTLREPLDTHGIGSAAERRQRVAALLQQVGLDPAMADRYPHEFSGGQRQRIGIARALALDPALLIADEAVSALDVSVQSQVLNLISQLQRERGIALLFISHDLAVIQHVSDEVAVMYFGRIVEQAPADDFFREPLHPYSQALLAAVPSIEGGRQPAVVAPGEPPSPLQPPPGCPFHSRCAQAMERCRSELPALRNTGSADTPRLVACHLY